MANLMDALVGMHYLRKGGGRYGLQPSSSTFLVRGKKTYMGASTQPVSLSWDIWGHLTEAVKTGRPHEAVKFFKWSFSNGNKMAEDLDYIPMPESVVKLIEKTWSADIKS